MYLLLFSMQWNQELLWWKWWNKLLWVFHLFSQLSTPGVVVRYIWRLLSTFVQIPVKVEHFDAAMVSVSAPSNVVMEIEIALMEVMKLVVVSYWSILIGSGGWEYTYCTLQVFRQPSLLQCHIVTTLYILYCFVMIGWALIAQVCKMGIGIPTLKCHCRSHIHKFPHQTWTSKLLTYLLLVD